MAPELSSSEVFAWFGCTLGFGFLGRMECFLVLRSLPKIRTKFIILEDQVIKNKEELRVIYYLFRFFLLCIFIFLLFFFLYTLEF